MESSGSVQNLAVRAPDLRALVERDGPFASIYLATPGDVENAGPTAHLRWSTVRRSLTEQGADDEALDAIEPLVAEAHLRGTCLAAIASRDGVLHVEYGQELPPCDIATWDQVPVIAPLVGWRQSTPPYVVVVADRTGADLAAFGRSGRAVRTATVDQDDTRPVRKVAPGGWSQPRYQRRVENTWEQHAHEVADAVRELSDDVGAEVIVVAGDVRAVELMERHLPERVLQQIKEISGGRAAGVDRDAMEAETARWVADAASHSTAALMDKFREELGQGDRAVDGIDATFRALNEARVDVLLFHDDWRDRRRAASSSDGAHVALWASTLRESFGVAAAREGRLIDIALAAALRTGAAASAVPDDGPREGLGAVLRWAL